MSSICLISLELVEFFDNAILSRISILLSNMLELVEFFDNAILHRENDQICLQLELVEFFDNAILADAALQNAATAGACRVF